MMFHFFLRPGQGFQRFGILTSAGKIAVNGHPLQETFQPAGEITGILMLASQGDLQQWRGTSQFKQETHPVMFKIIQVGGNDNRVKPTDILTLGNRKFTVKGIHNPGGLNHFTVYFAEERKDLQ